MQTAQFDLTAESDLSPARPRMQDPHSEVSSATGRSPLNPLAVEVTRLTLADRRKDEFLAMLSHELRSPLTAIQNAIAILRSSQGADATVQGGMYELIGRQVRQMSLLASGLLDVGGIERGQLQLQYARIDLITVLISAIETIQSDINRRGQVLSAVWPRSSVWVLADPNRLEQVFVNLLINASKYSDEGGQISMSLLAQDGYAVVQVKDSGLGIAANALAHIFDLFMQVPVASASASAPVRPRSGVGLGLALVRKLVEMHDGSVTATSAGLGQGSEFVVRLRALNQPTA
jgi:signal transduction histidine kinase